LKPPEPMCKLRLGEHALDVGLPFRVVRPTVALKGHDRGMGKEVSNADGLLRGQREVRR
jgi:hypothetical protein